MTDEQMQNFIILAESLSVEALAEETVVETEVAEGVPPTHAIFEELGQISFRLRTFMESEGGEYALGVEMGMQRAADMIDNVISRHSQGDVF